MRKAIDLYFSSEHGIPSYYCDCCEGLWIHNGNGKWNPYLKEQIGEKGKERPECHRKLINLSQSNLSKDAEKALHADLATPAAILEHLRVRVDQLSAAM